MPISYDTSVKKEDQIGTQITVTIPLKLRANDSKRQIAPTYYIKKALSEEERDVLNVNNPKVIVVDNIVNRVSFNNLLKKFKNSPSIFGEPKDLVSLDCLASLVKNEIIQAINSDISVILILDNMLGKYFSGDDIVRNIRAWWAEFIETEDIDGEKFNHYLPIKFISYSGNSFLEEESMELYDGFLEKSTSSDSLGRCLFEEVVKHRLNSPRH